MSSGTARGADLVRLGPTRVPYPGYTANCEVNHRGDWVCRCSCAVDYVLCVEKVALRLRSLRGSGHWKRLGVGRTGRKGGEGERRLAGRVRRAEHADLFFGASSPRQGER